jgi:hypothetical protein
MARWQPSCRCGIGALSMRLLLGHSCLDSMNTEACSSSQ